MSFRIGFGFDVHPLAEGTFLPLGGFPIPSNVKSVGHSDADVLIHAICDALLGAANLRDIGFHFPDTDASLKNIDSKILLEKVMVLLRKNGYELGNLDCTVCLEMPKINPHIEDMQAILAGVMLVKPSQISIKATTNEKLGFIGRGEGITAYAAALIELI